MTRRERVAELLRKSRANGWTIYRREPAKDGRPGGFVMRCAQMGCLSVRFLGENQRPLKPCDWPHAQGYARPALDAYADLARQLVERRHALGLSQDDVAVAAGLSDGHLNKLEASARRAELPTLILWAGALGLRLSLEPCPLPQSTLVAVASRSGHALRQPVRSPKLYLLFPEGKAERSVALAPP